MKKQTFVLALLIVLFSFPHAAEAQFFKIDTEFYSNALKEVRKVSIYLPQNYYQEQEAYYPTVYFLHGWGGNQNALDDQQLLMSQLLLTDQIQPMIIVCADNGCQPFGTGVYVNSVITGNFEDFTIEDLIPWVEENYRAIPQKEARGVFGQSLGGYGAFRFGILHKDKLRAISSHAAQVNYDLWMPAVRQMLMIENSGPPYYFDFYGFSNDVPYGPNGFFTRSLFLVSSGYSPDPNSNQTYINPRIIQFPYNQYCQLLDSVYNKWKAFNIPTMLSGLGPADSVSILYGCGLYDETMAYYPNFALQDTLEHLNLSYEFFWHKAGHVMPGPYFVRSLVFMDSLLLDYSIYTESHTPARDVLRIEAMPNPFTDYLDVRFEPFNAPEAFIEILDLKGVVVQQMHQQLKETGSHQIRLNTNALSPGVYFIRVTTGRFTGVAKAVRL